MCRGNKGCSLFSSFSLLLISTLAMTACGLLESKKADYRSIQPSKSLDVPPELTAPAKDDRYTVSETSSKGTTYSSYTAERATTKAVSFEKKTPPVTVLPQDQRVRIERAGGQRWLVVTGTPDVVWPQLKKFVEARGFVIKAESPERGTIETDWAEKPIFTPNEGIRGQLARAFGTLYSTSERDKFRFRLEAGVEPGTTDVFVSHRGVEEVFVSDQKDITRWQPRNSDANLEMELMGQFIQSIGLNENRALAVVEASKNAPGDRARIAESDGRIAVNIDERFDRAWRRVGLALDRNGFTVEDRDRANGRYFVKYTDPMLDKQTKSKGWLDSLAFWRDEKASSSAESNTYRVVVKGLGEDLSVVEVQDKDGIALANSTARKILEVIRTELK